MHVTDEDVELFVFDRLSADRTAAIQSHVADCPTCRVKVADVEEFKRRLSELSARQAAYDEREKRPEPHVSPGDLGTMLLLLPPFAERSDVQIVDVSQDGVELRARQSVSSGTLVQIRLKNSFVLGEVRYCVRVDDDFFYVGIHVQTVTRVTLRASPGSGLV